MKQDHTCLSGAQVNKFRYFRSRRDLPRRWACCTINTKYGTCIIIYDTSCRQHRKEFPGNPFFYLCFVFCPMPAYLGTSILIRGSLLECQPPLLSWHSDKSVPFWHHQNRYPTTDQSHDPTVRLQCDDCILQEPPPTPAY